MVVKKMLSLGRPTHKKARWNTPKKFQYPAIKVFPLLEFSYDLNELFSLSGQIRPSLVFQGQNAVQQHQ